jgi:hypothetical protein
MSVDHKHMGGPGQRSKQHEDVLASLPGQMFCGNYKHIWAACAQRAKTHGKATSVDFAA